MIMGFLFFVKKLSAVSLDTTQLPLGKLENFELFSKQQDRWPSMFFF